MLLCRVDYGHAEAAHKFGSDPRRYNVMSKKFVTDDKGHVRVSRPLGLHPALHTAPCTDVLFLELVYQLWCARQGLLLHN